MKWGEVVLARDKECVCGLPAEEAHHIYPRAEWPELRLLKENGIGLCKSCHKAIYREEEHHIERFLQGRAAQSRCLGGALASVMSVREVHSAVR